MLHRFAATAMACRFEMLIDAPANAAPGVRAAAEEALAEVQLWHRRLSKFEPASDVSRINRLAAQSPVRIDSELFDLLSLCDQAMVITEGRFCPLLPRSPQQTSGSTFSRPAPSDSPLLPRLPRLVLDPLRSTVAIVSPDAPAGPANSFELDLGGIAKGWALDAAAAILCECDITLALLHGGTSSIRALGAPPELPGWPISISAAESNAAGPPLVVQLNGESLSVSAHHGRPAGHITSPDSGSIIVPGQPGVPTMAVATAYSAAWAEVWSTALLIDPHLCAHPHHAEARSGSKSVESATRFVAVRNNSAWKVLSTPPRDPSL